MTTPRQAIPHPTTVELSQSDRIDLALASLVMVFLATDGVITDSDILDAAEAFTTNKLGDLTWGDRDEIADRLDLMLGEYLVTAGVAQW